MQSFSIVIPVYNESEILEQTVVSLLNKCHQKPFQDYRWELILVENGSQDNTWQICQQLKQYNGKIRLARLKKPSYGKALRQGIITSRFTNVVIFNADYWDINFLKQALSLIKSCDVVIGSKTLIASQDLRPFFRRQISYWFNTFLRIIFNYQGTDTHGIKVIKRQKLLPLVKRCLAKYELFDTELLLRAAQMGMIIAEVPLKAEEVRPTRYNNFKRLTNTFRDVLTIFYVRYLKNDSHRRRFRSKSSS